MDTRSTHVLIDLWECNGESLDNPTLIVEIMRKAAIVVGATPVCSFYRHFGPCGVSGVMMVEESHLSIHTWPESGYAAVDIFTCGRCKPLKAVNIFTKGFESGSHDVQEFIRGLPGGIKLEVPKSQG